MPSNSVSGDRIGHYKLLEPIGEGGFGTVWTAEQQEPVRRRVALKIIKLGMDTKEVIARFEAERQALAMMDHPNIARVFDGGATEQGRPYFVMELVKGVRITDYCDAVRLSTEGRLKLFIEVCQAVQHAHQKGVIHRDLKPSNVLVTVQDDKPVPKVIDFGIAKAAEQKLTEKTFLTRLNQVIGTPAYMSPEQAGLGSLDIDTRSDIYSLGVLLYELLTGRTPFSNEELLKGGLDDVLRTIREKEPPKPSTRLTTLSRAELAALAEQRRETAEQLHRLLRGDLDWIALKALEKDRSRRYQSANDFATDLRRYLGNEPIAARPPSNLYRFQKLARRNKLVFGAGSAVIVALIAGLITTSSQKARATLNLAQARLNAYASEINLAQQAVAENNQSRALELLERHRPKPGEDDLRGFEWRYLWQLSRPNELASFRHSCNGVAFSPDGRLFAAAGTNIIVRETSSHRVVATLPGEPLSLAFSPREKILAAGETRRVRLWNMETWSEAYPPLTNATYPVRFSPDGAWLITGTPASPIPKHRLWRADTWEAVAMCLATPELPWQLRNAVAFSPDGTLLVTPWLKTTDEVCGLKLWKVPTLEPVKDIFAPELSAWSAAFLPDGQHLLIGTFYGELVVWSLQKHAIIQTIKENHSGINTISVSGGDVFATASHDHRVTLWDSQTIKVLARLRGHTDSIWASSLSPDGAVVATGSFDGTTKLWDGTARESANSIDHGSLIAGFTRDSRTLILAPREGDYRWHLIGAAGTGHSTVEVPASPPLVWDYIHRPYDVFGDAPVGALGRTDGSVELWDLALQKRLTSWSAGSNSITAALFSPDGTQLATGDKVAGIKTWNVATREQLAAFQLASPPLPSGGAPVSTLAFSRDGKMLAAGAWPFWGGDIVLWDLVTRQEMLRLKDSKHNVSTVTFSENGRLLASASVSGSAVHLWDIPSGTRHPPLRGHVTGIVQVVFSPDGKTLATGGYDTVKLWNVATEQEIANLPYRGTLRGLCFSRDGRTLAVSYLTFPGHRVRLHHAPSFKEIAAREKATDQPNR